MELHLIRHPRPAIDAGICYGQLDVGIIDSASEVAARLQPLLPPRFELHASPLQRARLLAEALGEPLLDARLQEISFGSWEGQTFSSIGSAIDDWAADPLHFRAPGGESAHQLSLRVLDWLEELQTQHAARQDALPQVIVAHGGPLRVIAGHLLGLPAERWLGLDFACGQITRIDVEDWGTALRWFNR